MNLAIEYIVRSGLIKKMLKLPSSLFVIDTITGAKKVVTIAECYNINDQLLIKHWILGETSRNEILPPFNEFTIQKEELFNNKNIIIEDHTILKFQESPFRGGVKQTSDPPYSDVQKMEYENSLERFTFTGKHCKIRERWLWRSFMEIYCPSLSNIRKYGYTSDDALMYEQQSMLCKNYIYYWKNWICWKKYLLNFEGVAAELAFKKEYDLLWANRTPPCNKIESIPTLTLFPNMKKMEPWVLFLETIHDLEGTGL